MTRRAARIDDNQRDIVTALERAGCTVQSLASLGEGVPDLLVGVPMRMEFGHGGLAMWQIPARNIIIEVKDGAKPPSRRRLTEDQIKWRAWWKGPQPVTVESVADALAAIK